MISFVVLISTAISGFFVSYPFHGDASELIQEAFNKIFPYAISYQRVSWAVIVFNLVSQISYFLLNRFNEKKKEKFQLGEDDGLDPAALERVSVIFAFMCALIITMIVSGVSLPTVSIITAMFAAGIGFATQDILKNMAAGAVLIWDGSFKKGDVISIEEGKYGQIDRLTLRYLVIKDRNEINFLVPYSELISREIQNWSHDSNRVRLKIDIGVDYEANVSEAINFLENTAKRVDRVLSDPSPKANIMSLGDSAINIQLRFWIEDPEKGIRNVMSKVYQNCLNDLKTANVEIPFPKLDVTLHSISE